MFKRNDIVVAKRDIDHMNMGHISKGNKFVVMRRLPPDHIMDYAVMSNRAVFTVNEMDIELFKEDPDKCEHDWLFDCEESDGSKAYFYCRKCGDDHVALGMPEMDNV